MNEQLIKKYIEAYKTNFTSISEEELYKWEAVKQFQDTWNIQADDFYTMAKTALSKVKNLMDAGMYFPKEMILSNAEISSEKVRQLFKDLYKEEDSLLTRIENFKTDFEVLNSENFVEKKHYQDDRAVIVYLTLKYPDRYYFYKFGMFNGFASKTNYIHKPIRGRIENVFHFENLCENIKHIVSQDQELLRLHNSRLTENCYVDESLHILTQDVIYAISNHLDTKDIEDSTSEDININTSTILVKNVSVTTTNVSFNGSITNHIQNNKENKRIGDLGELFVIAFEREKLNNANKPKLAKKVAHHAKEKGDGLGYDVLSFDTAGNEIFIEVKATKGNKKTPFFITRNELERSKKEQDNYFIYRVYNFNDSLVKGDILEIQGDASSLCVEAVNYKVKMV